MQSVSARRINSTLFSLVAILILSSFTHLWNAVGFPDIFFDEGVYMRRAMHILSGLGPQEASFHDHPFFGQIFLAATLGLVGFPNSLHVSTDPISLSSLYLVPRIIMGVIAIVDTFLVYKIADNRYGKKVALISGLLFAVMPITWLIRRILLDSILLPFLLTSILLAQKAKNSSHTNIVIIFSGICLGLAIFTKIPAFTMIPLVLGLAYFHSQNRKILAFCSIPMFLIPLLWPLQSLYAGQFKSWIQGIIFQTHRPSFGLPYITLKFFQMDPILFLIGIAGIIYAVFRKDYFILFWFFPFVIFLAMIGFNQYFYWIPVLPVFCISAAILVEKILGRVKTVKLNKILTLAMISAVGIFGFISTTLLISTDTTTSQFQAASFVLQNVKNTNDTTILASPSYSWIFNYVFHKENVFIDYNYALYHPIETRHVLLIADPHFMIDIVRGQQLLQLYNSTNTIATFHGNFAGCGIPKYPYFSLAFNCDGRLVEIKEK